MNNANLNNAASAIIDQICSAYRQRPDALLEILHDVQQQFGHVSEAHQRQIADLLNIARAEVHGVVSYYDDFHTGIEAGPKVRICMGEACQAQGARLLEAELASVLGDTNIERVYCLGNCALGPSATINGKLCAHVNVTKIKAALDEVAR